MRTLALLVVLIIVCGAPAVAGQSAGEHLADDDSGDVAFFVMGNPVDPAGRWPTADAVSLDAEETADDLVFRLEVASLDPGGEVPFADSVRYEVFFSDGAVRYRILAFRFNEGAEAGFFAVLQQFDPATGDASHLAQIPIEADEGASTIVMSVPRSLVLDENGAPPFPGSQIGLFHVTISAMNMGDGNIEIEGQQFGSGSTRVRDEMPNEGNATSMLPIRIGAAQSGHARLVSQTPFRASNGEATTFVFTVRAHNTGEETDRFQLKASGYPSSWAVTLPVGVVEVPAGANVSLPLLVTTPFAHNHGNVEDFLVELQSISDPGSVGRLRLGVRYLAIPQPAGHHDTLYLHSEVFADDPFTTAFATLAGFGLQGAYMNAFEADEGDEDVDVPARRATNLRQGGAGPGVAKFVWDIPLSPGLAIGLDFDLARTGTLRVPLTTTLPLNQATLDGAVYYAPASDPDDPFDNNGGRPAERVAVARLEPTDPVDVGAQGSNVFEATVTPLAAGDYLAFAPGAALWLRVNLTALRPDSLLSFGPGDRPLMEPGGTLQLPLFEYRDQVDDVFGSLASVMLQGTPQEALANPGETAVFNLQVMNHGGDARDLALSLSGTNGAWARVLGSTEVRVGPGETRDVAVAVTVPKDASDADTADLILQAADPRDASARSLLRLLVTVDTDADHADMATHADQLDGKLREKSSPGVGGLLLLAAVGLALALARRRR